MRPANPEVLEEQQGGLGLRAGPRLWASTVGRQEGEEAIQSLGLQALHGRLLGYQWEE